MTMFVTLGSNLDDHCIFTFGTISCGMDTWSGVWSKGTLIVTYDSLIRNNKSNHHTHFYHTDWNRYPTLDLLVVQDEGHQKFNERWTAYWCCPSKAWHLLIFHFFPTLVSTQGWGFKRWYKEIRVNGYDLHSWHVRANQCGLTMWSHYLVTFCFSFLSSHPLPLKLPVADNPRSCRNLIQTYGIPHTHYFPIKYLQPDSHPVHSNFLGTSKNHPVFHWDGPYYSVKGHI